MRKKIATIRETRLLTSRLLVAEFSVFSDADDLKMTFSKSALCSPEQGHESRNCQVFIVVFMLYRVMVMLHVAHVDLGPPLFLAQHLLNGLA